MDPVAPVAPRGPAGPGAAVTQALNASAANIAVTTLEYLIAIPFIWLTKAARDIASSEPTMQDRRNALADSVRSRA